MKKILTVIAVLGVIAFGTNAVMACDCGCGEQKSEKCKCSNKCECGCQDGNPCTCYKKVLKIFKVKKKCKCK